MGLDRRRILETSLFDSEQILTVHYLSRHADISIDDARDELTIFLEENKNRTELHAVYIISGEVRAPNASSSRSETDKATVCKRYRTQLVRDCHLDNARQAYDKLDTCEIYCLHTKPIKSLCLLYSLDNLEDEEYTRTDPEHSWLTYPEAEVKREEMLAQNAATAVPEVHQEDVSKEESETSTPKNSEPVPKKIKSDVTSIFIKAAMEDKQKQEKPMDLTEINQDSATELEVPSHKEIKRRGQRIVIDGTEEIKQKGSKSLKTLNRKNVSKKITKTNTSKAKESSRVAKNEQFSLLTQDDLFCDDGSSPERMDVDEPGKFTNRGFSRNSIPSSGDLNTAKDDYTENKNVQESQTKATRKEYVTETFLDSDGFMVTKQVLKEIEVEKSPADGTHEKAVSGVKHLDSRAQKAFKVPQGQAKISSFFQKK